MTGEAAWAAAGASATASRQVSESSRERKGIRERGEFGGGAAAATIGAESSRHETYRRVRANAEVPQSAAQGPDVCGGSRPWGGVDAADFRPPDDRRPSVAPVPFRPCSKAAAGGI